MIPYRMFSPHNDPLQGVPTAEVAGDGADVFGQGVTADAASAAAVVGQRVLAHHPAKQRAQAARAWTHLQRQAVMAQLLHKVFPGQSNEPHIKGCQLMSRMYHTSRLVSWCFEPSQPQEDYIRAKH